MARRTIGPVIARGHAAYPANVATLRPVVVAPSGRTAEARERAAADAEHVAACWNACEGYDPAKVAALLVAIGPVVQEFDESPGGTVSITALRTVAVALYNARDFSLRTLLAHRAPEGERE